MRTIFLLLFVYSFAFGSDPSSMKAYIEKTGKTPNEFIIDKFNQKKYVILPEIHRLKHEVEFVTSLLSDLQKAEVYTLALDFGNVEDQSKIDKLLNSKSFHRDLAIDIMRNYKDDGIFGYQEYLDFYKRVWDLNQVSQKKFRIIFLGNTKTKINLSDKSLIIAKNIKYDNAYTIGFHTAIQKDMDEVYDILTSKNPVAFDIKTAPYKVNYDGYVFLKSHDDFEPLTWIDDFIDESYLQTVKNYFKDLKVETVGYANDVCRAYHWVTFEMEKGKIL
jgi:hypothetical protein